MKMCEPPLGKGDSYNHKKRSWKVNLEPFSIKKISPLKKLRFSFLLGANEGWHIFWIILRLMKLFYFCIPSLGVFKGCRLLSRYFRLHARKIEEFLGSLSSFFDSLYPFTEILVLIVCDFASLYIRRLVHNIRLSLYPWKPLIHSLVINLLHIHINVGINSAQYVLQLKIWIYS